MLNDPKFIHSLGSYASAPFDITCIKAKKDNINESTIPKIVMKDDKLDLLPKKILTKVTFITKLMIGIITIRFITKSESNISIIF